MAKRKGLADRLLAEQAAAQETCSVDGDDDSRTVETYSEKVKTVADALRKAKVDQSVWQVERFVVNSWEMGAKLPSGKICVTPLWQVKVWLKPKRGWTAQEFREELLKGMRRHAPSYRTIRHPRSTEECLLEVSPVDTHLAKHSWKPEAGENQDLASASRDYVSVIEKLLVAPRGYRVSRVLLVIGNDFLHADNAANTTTRGTPQDVDGRWQKAFLVGRQINVKAIELALQIAPVDVVVVPGNHDTERMFYLGDALECWFRNCKHVTVNNAPSRRKYYHYGPTLLGFTHGNEEKHRDLPALMAQEQPELWGKSRFREWHIGHMHKSREMVWVNTDQFGRVVVRTLPGLTATDAWHAKMGYLSHRASEAYLYHAEHGYVGHFQAHP